MTAPSTISRARSAPSPRPTVRFSRRGRLRWWAEALLAISAYEIYNLVQAATAGEITPARRHAQTITSLEHRMHLHLEPAVNHFAVRHNWIALGSAYYYELAHLTVTAAVLVFLWFRRPDAYLRFRNGLLSINLLALLVFWLWPVAPPRLAGDGIVDVLVRNDVLGAAHVSGSVVNLYAAMPSLHVAWACWCAAALALTSKFRWRYLVWLYPLMTSFAVIATGNHYLLDAGAGAALSAAVLVIPRHLPVDRRRCSSIDLLPRAADGASLASEPATTPQLRSSNVGIVPSQVCSTGETTRSAREIPVTQRLESGLIVPRGCDPSASS